MAMYLRIEPRRPVTIVNALRLLIAVMIILLSAPLVEARVVNLRGVIFTLSSDRVPDPVAQRSRNS